ncbi:MAG TPA: DsbA family protein [Phenylobacterium sp.]|nr:DsbA family protein [Phenylobacterium sp.]HQN52619.1 DsbA family protein [Phenylobacterium sp.]HQP20534.1 DsbA family protein [Phenylobacterium sp.]
MRPLLYALAVLTLSTTTAADAAPKPAPGLPAGGVSMGNPKAKVLVEEYASMSCSHCATFNNEVFPEFKKAFIDTGKVRYVLHEYVTPPENVAAAGWFVARCAGPDGYFKVVDAFFRSQAQMFDTRDVRGALMAAGKAGGLTEDGVRACLKDPAQLTALEGRLKAAVDRGVQGTPTFYINGEPHVGEASLDELAAAIKTAKPLKPAKKK